MATLNLTPGEYADITAMFLLDKLLHPNEVIPENERFNKLASDLKSKGVRAPLTNYYLRTDSEMRLNIDEERI